MPVLLRVQQLSWGGDALYLLLKRWVAGHQRVAALRIALAGGHAGVWQLLCPPVAAQHVVTNAFKLVDRAERGLDVVLLGFAGGVEMEAFARHIEPVKRNEPCPGHLAGVVGHAFIVVVRQRGHDVGALGFADGVEMHATAGVVEAVNRSEARRKGTGH